MIDMVGAIACVFLGMFSHSLMVCPLCGRRTNKYKPRHACNFTHPKED